MLDDQLLKMAALAKLDGPAPPDLKFLRDWFQRRDMGFFPIWGLDKNSWDDEGDLIAVKPRLLQDPVTRLFEALISLFHRFLGEKLKVRNIVLGTIFADSRQNTNTWLKIRTLSALSSATRFIITRSLSSSARLISSPQWSHHCCQCFRL